ncbi:MAG TPA: transposase [Ktedonobacterales bacterium]
MSHVPYIRGYHAHKQVMGRKRHLVMDTQGFALKVVVSVADTQDRAGAQLVAQAQVSVTYLATFMQLCA